MNKSPQQQLEEWSEFIWQYDRFTTDQFFDAMFEIARLKCSCEGIIRDFELAYNTISQIG